MLAHAINNVLSDSSRYETDVYYPLNGFPFQNSASFGNRKAMLRIALPEYSFGLIKDIDCSPVQPSDDFVAYRCLPVPQDRSDLCEQLC